MQDSPRDQSTVVAVLCAFVSDHAHWAHTTPTDPQPTPGTGRSVTQIGPLTDIQAALTVVGTRNAAHDGAVTVVDLNHTHLVGANLVGANLVGANLRGANLIRANLTGADRVGADFTGATLNAP